nr:MAG TPA: hypothetical protein [Caudoviricetes sp.]
MSRRNDAIVLLNNSRCMINSCLAKTELKEYNGDFVEYLIRQLSILNRREKEDRAAKESKSILRMPGSDDSVSDTLHCMLTREGK